MEMKNGQLIALIARAGQMTLTKIGADYIFVIEGSVSESRIDAETSIALNKLISGRNEKTPIGKSGS